MSKKIEIHLLQSFPPANLNRDDSNMPKDCEFGGVRRARISSQCFKRAIRLHPEFSRLTGVQPAERTRLLAEELRKGLVEAGKPAEEAQKVAQAFTSTLLGGMDEKAPEKTKVLFFISAAEKADIVRRLTAEWEKSLADSAIAEPAAEDKKKKKADKKPFDEVIKEYHKQFVQRSSAPDIALFGRMLAEDPKLNLDAACQVSHAISTHKVSMETDFFTALDDLQPRGETGAAMMELTGFNSATFYRYAAIDWKLLSDNLGGNIELARQTVLGFIRAAVRALPTGKQNSFAAQTPPGLLLVVVRNDGQAWSLANAFEKPVQANGSGFMGGSVQRLVEQWQRLNKVYGDSEFPAQAFILCVDESFSLAPLQAEESFAELERKVKAALLED